MNRVVQQVIFRIKRFQTMQRINCGLARAAATRSYQTNTALGQLNLEFSGLSQNGEDGITDYLTQRLNNPNKYFVEIGSSDGTENNTSWFAIARRWQGLMVEGNKAKADYCSFIMSGLNIGVRVSNRFINLDNLPSLLDEVDYLDADLFSLDIDGVDYHVAAGLLGLGFRPKIVIVEYNSCFGPVQPITIPYTPSFDYRTAHSSELYYGASIAAWRGLWESVGYQFVTVDSNGVNAFFVRRDCIDQKSLETVRTIEYQENFYQKCRFRKCWQAQFELIRHLPMINPGT
jgi:hypothetical protein